jgi:hypothetical protein
MAGIEPAPSAPKADMLTITPHPKQLNIKFLYFL